MNIYLLILLIVEWKVQVPSNPCNQTNCGNLGTTCQCSQGKHHLGAVLKEQIGLSAFWGQEIIGQFQTQRHPACSQLSWSSLLLRMSFCSQLLSIAGAPALAFETSQELQFLIFLHGYCVPQIRRLHH